VKTIDLAHKTQRYWVHDVCIGIAFEEEFNTTKGRLHRPVSISSTAATPIQTQPANSLLLPRRLSSVRSSALNPSPRQLDHATQLGPKYVGLGFRLRLGLASSVGSCLAIGDLGASSSLSPPAN
jgi:hypothetical protein